MKELYELFDAMPYRHRAGEALRQFLVARRLLDSFLIVLNDDGDLLFAKNDFPPADERAILDYYLHNGVNEPCPGLSHLRQELLRHRQKPCGRLFYPAAGPELPLETLAALAAYLDDHLLYQHNREKLWGTSYISEVTKAFTESLLLEEIATRLLMLIPDFLGATASALFVVRGGEPVFFRAKGVDPGDEPRLLERLKEKITRVELDTGNFYISSRLDLMQPIDNPIPASPLLIAPFIIAGKVIGYMAFYDFALDARLTPVKMDVLATLVQQGSVALNNAQLYGLTRSMAITDELTTLHNHRFFMQRLAEETVRARRYHLPLSLLMIDLDDFKQVNDTYGHRAGDLVLERLGGILRKKTRSTDVVARYGGEEFSSLLVNTPKEKAREVADAIRIAVAGLRFDWEGKEFRVTASLGVAGYPEDADDFENILRRADAALYHSKRTGKNRFTLYEPTLVPRAEAPRAQ